MIDAREWVDRYCPADAPEEPRCADNIWPESLVPGDVMPDGSILCMDGAVCWSHPHLWLTIPQARNAAYYGWHVHDGFGSPRGSDQLGRTLVLVSRA